MTYLTEVKAWGPGVYQLEQTDPVIGGPGGVDNWQAQELANRSAYLKNEVEKRAPLASPALTGTPTAPTASAGTTTQQIATTAFVQQEIGGILIKDISGGVTTFTLTAAEAANSVIRFSGTLTNNVTVIFPTGVKRLWVLDNYTQGNYTLTCRAGVGSDVVITQGYKKIVAVGESLLYQAADDFHNLNLTGTPQAPTAAAGTNTTQIATTAFVSALAGGTVAASSSLAAAGYQKFPSGLIIQWGSAVTSGTTVSVTFPVAFSSACYVAIPVNFGGSFLYVCPTAVSKTAATFSANGSNQSFYWIAIGK